MSSRWGMIALLFLAILTANDADAKDKATLQQTLQRVYDYAMSVDTSNIDSTYTFSYKRYILRTEKRNFVLLAIPTMFAVAHGGSRKFAGEFYDKMYFHQYGKYDSKRLIEINTTPRSKRAMPAMIKYLTPEIYNQTIIQDFILSPFHRANRMFYKYSIKTAFNGTIKLIFTPKTDNTQLIKGFALLNDSTGRVMSTDFSGEYDGIKFHLNLIMGKEGVKSLLPVRCYVDGNFIFLGNKITADFYARYGLKKEIPDTGNVSHDPVLMDSIRPDTLSNEEKEVFGLYLGKQEKRAQDTTPVTKKQGKKIWKRIFWDYIGENLIQRYKQNFGTNNQGFVRISPILNPLYMGYSHRRGFYYRFDVRGSYSFSNEMDLSLRMKAGYSFKQKQFYFRIPLVFNYKRSKNGYIFIEVGNGNRIHNPYILASLQDDTLHLKQKNIEFKDTYIKMLNNYEPNQHWGFAAGFIFHHRQAVNAQAYEGAGLSHSYRSAAPMMELRYLPWGRKGPVLTLDYERSIKGFLGSNTSYERWEADASYLLRMSRLRVMSMRLGAGLYTSRMSGQYFLDYTNFQENNIPGGWNDDWSGEFELLHSEFYNLSKYYMRANYTYETPLLVMAKIPFVGHFVEMERLYASGLIAKNLHPYMEIGYGLTTRWISVGAFMAYKNFKYEGFGCKIGFELFRKW